MDPGTNFLFFTNLINSLTGLIGLLIPFIIGLAILVFLWGVLKFVTAAGDEEARKTGRSFMIWGVVGIFVMVSVWGLVNFLGSILDLDNSVQSGPELPGGATSAAGAQRTEENTPVY